MLEISLDSKKVIKYLNKVSKQTITRVDKQIDELSKTGKGMAKSLAPVDTGALKSSIISRTENKDDLYIGYVISQPIAGVAYNIYQEFGTGLQGNSNAIHPRAKSNLKNPVEGISYNSSINGFGAQPFMYPTFVYLEKAFSNNISKTMEKVIR